MIKKIVLLLFLGSMVYNCGSKRSIARKKHSKTKTEHVVIAQSANGTQGINSPEPNSIKPVNITSTEQYLAMYSAVAQNEMRLYGIPASITLAQGILESNSGKGTLAREANNHFGIKCHDWTGAKVYHDDDRSQECFRKYNDAKYSYRDHSLFLTTRKRYSDLFKLDKDDYKRWAKGLKAAGYATDRKYPDKLISLIERYRLYKLDKEVLGRKNKRDEEPVIVEHTKEPEVEKDTVSAISRTDQENTELPEDRAVSRDTTQNSSQELQTNVVANGSTYTVGEGDTLYSISKRYNLTVKELQELNGLTSSEISLGQELQVTSADNPKLSSSTYIVKQGDTLYSISKKYNTTVQVLQQLNGLNDTSISIGQELIVK